MVIGAGGLAGLLLEKVAYAPVYRAGAAAAGGLGAGRVDFFEQWDHGCLGARAFRRIRMARVPTAGLRSFGMHQITVLKLVTILVSLALMAAVYFIVDKTLFGAAVRATALDRETATIMGIDFRKIILFVFFVGPALGGLAGVFAGLYYTRIIYNLGWGYGLKAFTAVILGGIGNIPGAMLGGLLLGLMEALFEGFVSGAWKNVFVFIILIVILIIRPTGLLGERIAEKV